MTSLMAKLFHNFYRLKRLVWDVNYHNVLENAQYCSAEIWRINRKCWKNSINQAVSVEGEVWPQFNFKHQHRFLFTYTGWVLPAFVFFFHDVLLRLHCSTVCTNNNLSWASLIFLRACWICTIITCCFLQSSFLELTSRTALLWW